MMDLATLEIDVEQAKAGLEEYTKQIVGERSREDEAIATAYRAAARGLPIISLKRAIAAGGWFDNGLPRIAVCRADAQHCHVSWWFHRETLTYRDAAVPQRGGHRALVGARSVTVDLNSTSVPSRARIQYAGTTTVPIVPPRHRPKRGRLSRYHILWEVEAWDPTPPRDPALLRHIRGDLWSVLAVWDLTDIERHILSARIGT